MASHLWDWAGQHTGNAFESRLDNPKDCNPDPWAFEVHTHSHRSSKTHEQACLSSSASISTHPHVLLLDEKNVLYSTGTKSDLFEPG